MAFTNSAFAQFMVSMAGRLLRIVAGVLIIAAGIWLVGGTTGWIIAAVGLVPLLAGAFDFCLIVALFGGPLSGTSIRANHARPGTR
ncbi:MAG: DUF2892 domain-containing protein [Chloroflexota bacterium]